MTRRLLEIFLHVLFWGLVLWILGSVMAIESLEVLVENGVERRVVKRNYTLLIPLLFSLTGKAVWTYGHTFWAFPKAFLKRKWVEYFTALLILLAVSFGIEYALIAIYNSASASLDLLNTTSISLNLLAHGIFLGLSFAYGFAIYHRHSERMQKQLQEEKLSTELNFLKAQVNPHFLFNTLNNLFSMAESRDQPALANGIAQLAQLMRYMLDHGQKDRVPLRDEIDCIQSVIDIQNLRLAPEDDVVVAFQIDGDPSGVEIAPLILIPFVENAFKHGIRVSRPSFIKMHLLVDDKSIQFKVRNSSHPDVATVPERTGIGLSNVRRRLELIYPERHQLTVKSGDAVYSAELRIDLNTNHR